MNNTTIETPREKATWKTALRWVSFIPLSLISGLLFGVVLPRIISWFADFWGYGDGFGVFRIILGLFPGGVVEGANEFSLTALASEVVFGVIMVWGTLTTAGDTCPRYEVGVWTVCALMMLLGVALMYYIFPLWGVISTMSYLSMLVFGLSLAVLSPLCSYYLIKEKKEKSV